MWPAVYVNPRDVDPNAPIKEIVDLHGHQVYVKQLVTGKPAVRRHAIEMQAMLSAADRGIVLETPVA